MSNFPHSTGHAYSLSASSYTVQGNLENLITEAKKHPHARRNSVPESPTIHVSQLTPLTANDTLPTSSSDNRSARRSSAYSRRPVISTIREASYDDGAAILLGDDSEDPDTARSERTGLLKRQQESKARRRSYGATSEPVGKSQGKRRSSSSGVSGNSRSRSKARTPPRKGLLHGRMKMTTDLSDSDGEDKLDDDLDQVSRGRAVESRPLSPVSTRASDVNSVTHSRRMSHARFADDSSGDEGGDVVRGLLGSGGGAMLGRSGFGLTPSAPGPGPAQSVNGGNMGGLGLDFDPAEELDAEDLQLPVTEDGKEARVWTEALKVEIPILLRSSVPVFFTQMAEWSLVLASVVSIGHLGTTELAASSLASMTASVSSFSILQGMATSLDTLLPAAWTSSDPSRVGLWTQRQAVVTAMTMIPMFVLWWNVEGILLVLGQEKDVAHAASQYLRYLSFGIPGYGGNVVMKKYLQAQNLMQVPTYVLFIVAPFNILLNYLLVWGPNSVRLGFVGGALATAISYNFAFLLNLFWALFLGPREAFHPLKFQHVFSKLGTITTLGLSGTIMVSSEWWAWECCALAASLLGPTPLAAQSVLLSTASTFFQVPAALGVASAVRCGNLLGAGRAWEACWSSRACLILSIVFALINTAILVASRNSWGYLFNSDPEVVGIVASVLPFIALFQLTDGIAATAGAILRALGLHTTGALINLTCYYIIGLPLGLWLTFAPEAHLGLIGIWLGLSFALGYASVVSFMLVWRADWHRAVERVRERLGLGAKGEVGADGKWVEDDSSRLLADDESAEDGQQHANGGGAHN
ncbi:mate-domain-containing protein [Kockovaella imperatae]|uniref:Mate-domain-containing protein n=1 Tax=Kockovaella imperatae TaxID=4999 RepID=A0A1Y1UH15_9TREE|nr:mate-domain-containing protein [Kockovaella imperatae]ORX37338.1 mate-domain-containing protein [Kockovaella imperatae]